MRRVILFCMLVLTAFLAGCRKSAPDVEKMKQDFSTDNRTIYVDDVPYVLQLKSLDIDRRQTDDTEDNVWCLFVLEDDVYRLEGTVKFEYEYYNEGGWLLEDIHISDENLSITNDVLPDFMKKYTELNTCYYYGASSYDLIDSLDMEYVGHTSNEQNDYHKFEYNIYNEKKYCIDQGTYSIEWKLDKIGSKNYRWNYDEHKNIETTWQNITGVYKAKNESEPGKLTIDSYNPQTGEIHIVHMEADFGYVWKSIRELDDIILSGHEGYETKGRQLNFYYRLSDVIGLSSDYRLSFTREGKVESNGVLMEKVEDIYDVEVERMDVEQERAGIANANIGEYVTFGHYEQDNNTANGAEPIEWQVLAKEEGQTLLISRYALDCKPYNEERADVTWEICTIRSWLNNSFYNTAFDASEQERIVEVTNSNPDSYVFYNSDYAIELYVNQWGISETSVRSLGASGGNATSDKVFLLSYEEALSYFNSDEERKCSPTAYAIAQDAFSADGTSTGRCWWWLRSPGIGQNRAMCVNHDGALDYFVDDVDESVRPALWIAD